jgi:sugar phosphate isomerase/epimerase
MDRVARDLDLTYNVHLPADIFLGDPDPAVRARARETAFRFYHRTLPLSPTVYVLHLDSRGADGKEDPNPRAWVERSRESVEALSRCGMEMSSVAVENLNYPLERVRPLVRDMGMSFCLDMGHLLRYGFDVSGCAVTFLAEASMVHLHGVQDGVDHRGLEWVGEGEWGAISDALRDYRGGVSLEVFSERDLRSSLRRMEELRG